MPGPVPYNSFQRPWDTARQLLLGLQGLRLYIKSRDRMINVYLLSSQTT